MRRLLPSLVLVAMAFTRLSSGASTPTVTSTSTTSSSSTTTTTTSPTPALQGVQVDIIYPIAGAFYNITESLPVIFAFQNLSAAAVIGPVTFRWYILPKGKVGGKPEWGAGSNADWTMTLTEDDAPGVGPSFVLVNQTNVAKWSNGPYYPDGSIYELMWWLEWDTLPRPCDRYQPLNGSLLFNINITRDEPDLSSLAGHCPQFGGRISLPTNTAQANRSCETDTSTTAAQAGSVTACAVTVDAAMVTSMSSAVRSLVTYSSLSSAGSLYPMPTTTKGNAAAAGWGGLSLYGLVFACVFSLLCTGILSL